MLTSASLLSCSNTCIFPTALYANDGGNDNRLTCADAESGTISLTVAFIYYKGMSYIMMF